MARFFFDFEAVRRPRCAAQVNPVDSATSLHSSGYTTSRKFSGSGSDTDVVVSSARAYVAAVNKLIRWNMRRAAAEQVEAQEA